MDGRVINLRRSSVGSVIAPGMTLMEIVPDNKIYVVDANVSPMDIDVVQKLPVGPLPEDQPAAAQIRLTGLKQRTHVTLRAIIQRVSPDAIIDDKSGVSYFSARVSFDAGDPNFKRLLDNGELYAGMPAEVSFIASHRTMLQYLVQPLIDSFYRSFHEE
jgi:HlyD family secretion protein/epimerase transport system membrane fusion protein